MVDVSQKVAQDGGPNLSVENTHHCCSSEALSNVMDVNLTSSITQLPTMAFSRQRITGSVSLPMLPPELDLMDVEDRPSAMLSYIFVDGRPLQMHKSSEM